MTVRIAFYDLDRTVTRLPTWMAFLLFGAARTAPWRLLLLPAVGLAALARAAGLLSRDRLKETMHALMLGRTMTVIEEVGERLLLEIDDRFPTFVGRPADDADEDRMPAAFRDTSVAAAERLVRVRSKTTGYIQVIDHEALIATAREHDLIVRLHYQPGDFAHTGSVLVEAWPAERADEDAVHDLRRPSPPAPGARRSRTYAS